MRGAGFPIAALFASIVGCSAIVSDVDDLVGAVPSDGSAVEAGDAAADAAAAPICPAGAELCDDFETKDLRAWTEASPDPPVVEGTRPYRGAYSARARTRALPDGDGGIKRAWSSAFKTLRAPLATGKLAVRAYLYVDHAPAAGTWLFSANAADVHDGLLSIGTGPSAGRWGSFILDRQGSVEDGSAVELPLKEWFCFEWVLTLGPDGDRDQSVFVNGQDVPVFSSKVVPHGGAAAYTTVTFGIVQADLQDEEVFFDDVVIATDRIRCPYRD